MILGHPADKYLLRFREAAKLDGRLIELERWLVVDRPEPGTAAHQQRWNLCVRRLRKLLCINPLLIPHVDVIRGYLRAVFVGDE
jgi:hypothetical protein